MLVERVFVSSVANGFEGERGAARTAIESLQLMPLMFETQPSRAEPSKYALLPLVEKADVVVLILGPRYGWLMPNGKSPTEDEYDHALKTNTPVLAFVQEGIEPEPEQKAFIDKVSGGWDEGHFRTLFKDPHDLLAKIVAALNQHRQSGTSRENQPQAQARALELATRKLTRGSSSSCLVRVVIVPVGDLRLIDALVLDDGSLSDRAAAALRSVGLADQSAGIEHSASSSGLALSVGRDYDAARVVIGADGGVLVEARAASDSGSGFSLGSMVLSYPAAQELIEKAGSLAHAVWSLLPDGDRVRQVASAVSLPEGAQPFSLTGVVGNSVSGVLLPGEAVVAPDPASITPRSAVGGDEWTRRLAVHLKQALVDRGVNPQ